eukprot:TRINITY_DN55300_c0_g1_i1.p1 TRINITY_DN55300_c0_g1~~TRINITY_DN55300_c0_g1_i1.p1  ORF type:complete len:189 (+),score=9.84 TRINITY_DN55300_c0_g1_i1:35-568(+)
MASRNIPGPQHVRPPSYIFNTPRRRTTSIGSQSARQMLVNYPPSSPYHCARRSRNASPAHGLGPTIPTPPRLARMLHPVNAASFEVDSEGSGCEALVSQHVPFIRVRGTSGRPCLPHCCSLASLLSEDSVELSPLPTQVLLPCVTRYTLLSAESDGLLSTCTSPILPLGLSGASLAR